MPTTIPYDPSLVLGNIVDQSRIEQLEKIADAQKPMDSDDLILLQIKDCLESVKTIFKRRI